MTAQIDELKKRIRQADIISFDVFDTLIRRIVNTPETVFGIVGEQFGIVDFSDMRQKYQVSASQKAEREQLIPHADLDQIYDYIKSHENAGLDWDAVKAKELEAEKDCLYCNREMYEVYQYAADLGKRILITSDMYLTRQQIEDILENCGYDRHHAVYISSEVHATKYNGDIFPLICDKEGVSPEKILHIGDNEVSDFEHARKYGLQAYLYEPLQIPEERKGKYPSPIGYGTAQSLSCGENDFWYDMGVLIGGTLYTGLYQWVRSRIKKTGYSKIYFLARDGYNLYHIFRNNTDCDCEYLYMSRRSLLLAGIRELDEKTLELLPPFTFGQTVREVLSYIGMEEICGKNLREAGLDSLDEVVHDLDVMKKVKQLYVLNQEEFLQKCAEERLYAVEYFRKTGFFDQNNMVFDCGWNGSSQYLLERFLACTDFSYENYFLYVGILDTVKSRVQLKNRTYETYLFDYSSDAAMQERIKNAIAVFELFFGAPEQSVLCYDAQGVVFEQMDVDESFKTQICAGILDYFQPAIRFLDKYNIQVSQENAISAVIRLINDPTMEEAKTIGDIRNVDGFAKQRGVEKYIARVDRESFLENPQIEIYWLQGLIKRDDMDPELKKEILEAKGIALPEPADEDEADQTAGDVPGEKRADMAEVRDPYQIWISENESDLFETEELKYNPFFSVVVPVYNVVDEQLCACIESVRNQTYREWELWLIDDASGWENVRLTLHRYENEKGIHVHYREENGHISRATNDGIDRAGGEFIVFMDCDDTISPNALYEMAKKLNENPEYDFIYSDEDKLTEDGARRHSPFFKPDWSPDTFMSLMYTNHLAIYRTDLVRQTGGLRSNFNGAQDYDFTLRFMELSDNRRVGHIPRILYHWRERGESIASNPEAKPYALTAMEKAKAEALQRRGYTGRPEYVSDMFQYRIVYQPPEDARVSIIIPSKDNRDMLFKCLSAIENNTDYSDYEVIVVDNGSEDDTRREIEAYAAAHGIRYYYEKMAFNFSRMCNIGAGMATGNYLLFLNDDIEVFRKEWLSRMTGHAALPYAGAVGAKLLYPDSNIIQHVGIANLKIGPSHCLMHFSDQGSYYFGRNRMDYNYLAVTAACLLVRREKFEAVGGFDENLTVAYNDVDFCFKLYEAGYYNIVRNDVVMYHYESASRGSDDVDEEKHRRLLKERERLYDKHPRFRGKDPFYNCNLSPDKVDFSFAYYGFQIVSNQSAGRWIGYEDKESEFSVNIDHVLMEDRIHVVGWFFSETDDITNRCEVRLALKDPYGHVTTWDTYRIYREDVAQVLNNHAVYAGFECLIPYADLFSDKLEYQIGVLIRMPEQHMEKLWWSETRIPRMDTDVCQAALRTFRRRADDALVLHPHYEIEKSENGMIGGWAVIPQSADNDFLKLWLMFRDDGKWYCREVRRRMRADIAAEYARLPNALWSGFTCELPYEWAEDVCIVYREERK